MCVLHLDVCVLHLDVCVWKHLFDCRHQPSTVEKKTCCQVHVLCLPVYVQHFVYHVSLWVCQTQHTEVNTSLCSLNAKLTFTRLLPCVLSVEHWTRNQHAVVYRITHYIYFCAASICVKYSSTPAGGSLRRHTVYC